MPAVVGKRKMASAARVSPFCLASAVAVQADYVRFAQLEIGGTVRTLQFTPFIRTSRFLWFGSGHDFGDFRDHDVGLDINETLYLSPRTYLRRGERNRVRPQR